ncbi:MAG: KH domain-containing protein [Chloroflexota bacterium]|nr:KH domain-containing protein [Chloroflexota bacterium]
MKELIEFIVKAIVNNPDDVVVTEERSDTGVLLKLQVHTDDMGRVIGKQGRVVQAMRTLLRVVAVKQDTRVELVVI